MILKTNLKFKGSRNYLHGTDIFDAITNEISKNFNGYISKLIFRKFSKNQIEIHFDKSADETKISCEGIWKINKDYNKNFWIVSRKELITKKKNCGESQILKNSKIIKDQIILDHKNDYTCIENIVALTKKLSNELSPISNLKWIFGQIDLIKKLPKIWNTISIKNFYIIDAKFCKFNLEIDKIFYGKITFITSSI